jgi:hypothetical protein
LVSPTREIPSRRAASLHAARKVIYGVVFVGLAWFEWRGAFTAVLAALLLIEVGITLADFLEEDRTRRLPPLESVPHTVLTISYGLFLGLVAPVLWAWVQKPTAMVLAPHGWVSWLFTAYAVGVWAWSVRNTLAAIKLYRTAPPAQPSALHARGLQPQPATLVTGATGFVGSALVADLVRDGQRVIVLTRDALQARASFGPGVWAVDTLDAVPSETTIDAIVNWAAHWHTLRRLK